jgi:hypothetical protein
MDPRDPVSATVRLEFPFDTNGIEHVILFRGMQVPVETAGLGTARIELAGLELSRELYDALAGAGSRLHVEHEFAEE